MKVKSLENIPKIIGSYRLGLCAQSRDIHITDNITYNYKLNRTTRFYNIKVISLDKSIKEDLAYLNNCRDTFVQNGEFLECSANINQVRYCPGSLPLNGIQIIYKNNLKYCKIQRYFHELSFDIDCLDANTFNHINEYSLKLSKLYYHINELKDAFVEMEKDNSDFALFDYQKVINMIKM